jgi:hypothetical protein
VKAEAARTTAIESCSWAKPANHTGTGSFSRTGKRGKLFFLFLAQEVAEQRAASDGDYWGDRRLKDIDRHLPRIRRVMIKVDDRGRDDAAVTPIRADGWPLLIHWSDAAPFRAARSSRPLPD